MNGYFSSAGVFLIEAIFGLYIGAIMIRFLLQLVRADFYNPICQFLVKVTNPPLKPLRRIIPGIGGLDVASIVLMIALQLIEILLIAFLAGASPNIVGLLVISIGKLIALLLNVYMFSILIQIVLSWVGGGGHNPLVSLLYSLNEPVMRPARRILPPISGIDLSPILVFLAIGLLKILLVAPLLDLGRSLG